MDIKEIISIIYLCAGTIALLAGIIARFTKSKKVKEAAEYVKERCVDVSSLLQLIAEAETHADYSGENKRDFVITRYLKDHGMSEDNKILGVDELSDVIQTLVAFTKSVNIKPQDGETTTTTIKEQEHDTRGASGVCRLAR